MNQLAVPRLALLVEPAGFQRASLGDALSKAAFDVIACESAVAAELVVARVGPDLHVLITDVSQSDVLEEAQALAEFAAERFPHLQIITILGDKEVRMPRRVHLLRGAFQTDDVISCLDAA